MMKFACLALALLWGAVAFIAAFDGGLSMAHGGAVMGWMTAAMAFFMRDTDERRA